MCLVQDLMRSVWLITKCILRPPWATWEARSARKTERAGDAEFISSENVLLVSPSTLNYTAGGPECTRFYSDEPESRWRRHDKAALLTPDRYCKSIARSSMIQMAGRWTTLPIARNLAVRHYALRDAYMMAGRRREAGKPLAESA